MESKYNIPNSRAIGIRVLTETLALLFLVYPMIHIYVFLQGDLAPTKRGFFCDDQSIKHPVRPEEISVGECVLIWALIVLLVVPALELLHLYVFDYDEKRSPVCGIPLVFIELYRILGYFTFGALCTLLSTELAKYKVGRLRPYFLSLCKPELTPELCQDENGYEKWVENYQCAEGVTVKEIKEASKSFLSGHSSFSFYCATFLFVYLHARLRNVTAINEHRLTGFNDKEPSVQTLRAVFRALKVLRPFFQFGIICLALYISLTRISDYKHHPGDVLTGMFIGIAFALVILFFIMDLIRRPRTFKFTNGNQRLGEVATEAGDLLDGRQTTNAETRLNMQELGKYSAAGGSTTSIKSESQKPAVNNSRQV